MQRPPPPPHRRAKDTEIVLQVDEDLEAALGRLVSHLSQGQDVRRLGLAVTREAAARAALLCGVDALLAPTTPATPASMPAPATEAAETDVVGLTTAPVGQAPHPNWTPLPAPGGLEADMHQWYEDRGWKRFSAATPKGPAVLYWAPVAIHRPLCVVPFDGVHAVAVEGYGVAHVVPRDWAATRHGADTAEAREEGKLPELRRPMGPGLPAKASVLK